LDFRYRTVSVSRLAELRDWLAGLEAQRRISDNPTYRKYIHSFQYEPPKSMADARSIIVMAIPQKLAAVTVRPAGRARRIYIPCGYVDDGLTLKGVREALRQRVVRGANGRVEPAKLPLKTLAVRSGLARYGKNNITFVDGYGSFHQLLGFFSNQPLPDQWGELATLRLCKGCFICLKECPTQAIREEEFVIDAGRCLSLYNELPDPLPGWIPPAAHHSLVGCLKCQYPCPGNEEVIGAVEELADFSEAETAEIVSGRLTEARRNGFVARLRRFPAAADFDYFSRNLRLALAGAPYPRPS
jgi:epoxyqueuosine reductase